MLFCFLIKKKLGSVHLNLKGFRCTVVLMTLTYLALGDWGRAKKTTRKSKNEGGLRRETVNSPFHS